MNTWIEVSAEMDDNWHPVCFSYIIELPVHSLVYVEVDPLKIGIQKPFESQVSVTPVDRAEHGGGFGTVGDSRSHGPNGEKEVIAWLEGKAGHKYWLTAGVFHSTYRLRWYIKTNYENQKTQQNPVEKDKQDTLKPQEPLVNREAAVIKQQSAPIEQPPAQTKPEMTELPPSNIQRVGQGKSNQEPAVKETQTALNRQRQQAFAAWQFQQQMRAQQEGQMRADQMRQEQMRREQIERTQAAMQGASNLPVGIATAGEGLFRSPYNNGMVDCRGEPPGGLVKDSDGRLFVVPTQSQIEQMRQEQVQRERMERNETAMASTPPAPPAPGPPSDTNATWRRFFERPTGVTGQQAVTEELRIDGQDGSWHTLVASVEEGGWYKVMLESTVRYSASETKPSQLNVEIAPGGERSFAGEERSVIKEEVKLQIPAGTTVKLRLVDSYWQDNSGTLLVRILRIMERDRVASPQPPPSSEQSYPRGIRTDRRRLIKSPHDPNGPWVDVTGFAPGTVVRDANGKIFEVP